MKSQFQDKIGAISAHNDAVVQSQQEQIDSLRRTLGQMHLHLQDVLVNSDQSKDELSDKRQQLTQLQAESIHRLVGTEWDPTPATRSNEEQHTIELCFNNLHESLCSPTPSPAPVTS